MMGTMPAFRPALFAALLLCACGESEQEKAEKQKASEAVKAVAAAGDPVAPESDPAAGASSTADEGKDTRPCRDLASCRDACGARKPGACVLMQAHARREKKHSEAEKTASRMCDAGHPEACHVRHTQLGGNRRRAEEALTRACQLGYGQSCVSLAGRTRNRSKSDELRKRGVYLLDKHCQREDPYACTARGHAASEPPENEQPDPAQARWHYEKGCDLGDGEGCYALAEQLGDEQPKREVALLDRGCELGEARACARSGDHHASGKYVRRDPKRAAQAWQTACDTGDEGAAAACNSLADALEDGRLPRDPDRAAKLKARADQLGEEGD
jgi:uncharacterized protein